MKCERCQKAEATVHLTQMLKGQIKKLNLCLPCAKEVGIDLNSPISVSDVLMGLGVQPSEDSLESTDFDLSCNRCHMTRTKFKKHGRLGCPECYNTFMGELGALTKAMHHSGQHVGKIPVCQGRHARLTARIAALQKEIEIAVSKEEYEKAAKLRDEIHALKEEARAGESEGISHDD